MDFMKQDRPVAPDGFVRFPGCGIYRKYPCKCVQQEPYDGVQVAEYLDQLQ